MTVARANPAIISRFGLPVSISGVIITDPGQFGTRAGLQFGDVVAVVNDTEMSTTQDVRDALTDPGRWVKMDLIRRGQRVSLRFRL